jgi:hypothetical protein
MMLIRIEVLTAKLRITLEELPYTTLDSRWTGVFRNTTTSYKQKKTSTTSDR